jgi:hypothetical protein
MIRTVRTFASHEAQEAETHRYWSARTAAEKLDVAAELLHEAPLFRIVGHERLTFLPDPVLDADGKEIPPRKVVRKFSSHEEQEEWNRLHVRLR